LKQIWLKTTYRIPQILWTVVQLDEYARLGYWPRMNGGRTSPQFSKSRIKVAFEE
jgi:hypothetical protein